MWVTNLQIENIRSFLKTGVINFSKTINLFVGQNNSGKTTILNIIRCLQGNHINQYDIRVGNDHGSFQIWFDGDDLERVRDNADRIVKFGNYDEEFFQTVECAISKNGPLNKFLRPHKGQTLTFKNFEEIESKNLIIPFLSKRKVTSYSENVDQATVLQVTGNFSNLYSKIDRLSSPDFQPAHDEYREACLNIIGYPISAVSSKGGKRAAFIIRNQSHIPVSAMGEGVINILGLIVELCLAENQIFLIEEPENDIHPRALKELLQLMIKKSNTNQFFISTHSNIVTKILGTVKDSKIFQLNMEFESPQKKLPLSKITELQNDPENRRKVLQDLGYEFTDFDLYEGWLFFEESSAEEIIRDYLIPWFLENSKLQKFRTFSGKSISEIKIKFDDFNKMFVYLHLTEIYKSKAWIIIDSGEEEKKIIAKFKEYYVKHGWDEENFLQWSKHDFEEYYPSIFHERVKEIKESKDDSKRKLKAQLLKELKEWIQNDSAEAKKQFEISASEVLGILKKIEQNCS